MQFMDDSLLPENQDPLVIQVAPYAPSFLPRDSEDIPVSMKDQVQKAVDQAEEMMKKLKGEPIRMFDHILDELPPTLKKHKEELARELSQMKEETHA